MKGVSMKCNNLYCQSIIILAVLLAMATLMLLPRPGYSSSNEYYQITEYEFSGGGGRMDSEKYTVMTIYGHPISGDVMRNGKFIVSGGFIASALPSIHAEIDIDPDTLNIKSNGRWITCYITFPEGYPADLFIPEKVALTRVNGQTLDHFIFSDQEAIHYELTDNNQYLEAEDMEEFLKVKFIRSEVQAVVPICERIELTVTGNLSNGASFQGTDIIRVTNPEKPKGKPGKSAKK